MSNFVDITEENTRFVIKRNGEKVSFELSKMKSAITKAMKSIDKVDEEMVEKIANSSEISIYRNPNHIPHVDEIHDIVENKLMDSGLNDVAKEYIIYRSKHQPNIFKKRVNLKPYEYPQLVEYVDAIRHSYWVHTEFNFISDVQDFKVHLNDKERTSVTRAMLAISQIEIAVKSFWGDIYKKMPKPEIGAVGATFAESEVRHADAYSNLIQVLGLNSEFENLLQVPGIRKRIKYLDKTMNASRSIENKDYFE